jgi:hypothetical protein
LLILFWFFNQNKFGQLGLLHGHESLVPVRVSLPRVQSVACGWVHTLFVCSPSQSALVSSASNLLGLFAMLPRDILMLLLQTCHPVALSKLSCCSSVLRDLSNNDSLWRAQHLKRGGSDCIVKKTWKETYIMRFGMTDRPVKVNRWSENNKKENAVFSNNCVFFKGYFRVSSDSDSNGSRWNRSVQGACLFFCDFCKF